MTIKIGQITIENATMEDLDALIVKYPWAVGGIYGQPQIAMPQPATMQPFQPYIGDHPNGHSTCCAGR